jgi:hypothetical protein
MEPLELSEELKYDFCIKIENKPTGGFPNIMFCNKEDINEQSLKNREFAVPKIKTISIRDILNEKYRSL